MLAHNLFFRRISWLIPVLAVLFCQLFAENPVPAVAAAAINDDKTVLIEEFKKNCENLQKKIDDLESQLRSEEFIEQRISLAELNEVINKIEEDLSSRIDLLDRNDKAEIVKILREKERALLKHLQDIESFANPDAYKKKTKKTRYVLAATVVTMLSLVVLVGAAYNPDCGWDWPTRDRLFENIGRLRAAALLWWQSFDKKTPVVAHDPAPAVESVPLGDTGSGAMAAAVVVPVEHAEIAIQTVDDDFASGVLHQDDLFGGEAVAQSSVGTVMQNPSAVDGGAVPVESPAAVVPEHIDVSGDVATGSSHDDEFFDALPEDSSGQVTAATTVVTEHSDIVLPAVVPSAQCPRSWFYFW